MNPRLAGAWLALRSLFWAALFPGLLAGYVPWRYFGVGDVVPDRRDPLQWAGLAAAALGAAPLAACIRELARRGRGTLSPADPPSTLVVQGLYRRPYRP